MAENHNDSAIITHVPAPGILICNYHSMERGYRVRRSRGTKDWLITFTVSGQGRLGVTDGDQIASAGDLILLKPECFHHYETWSPPWDFYWAHFLPRTSWTGLLDLPEPAKGLLYLPIAQQDLRSRIIGCFQRMIRDNRSIHDLSQELSMNALEEILLTVSAHRPADSRSRLDPRIQDVLQHMADSLHAPHTLDSLADIACLSPSRLSHLFREQVGESVISTLLSMRLQQAAKLLEYTTRSIAEVAAEVGFPSPYYFTKQFTAFFGVNPRGYRKRVQAP